MSEPMNRLSYRKRKKLGLTFSEAFIEDSVPQKARSVDRGFPTVMSPASEEQGDTQAEWDERQARIEKVDGLSRLMMDIGRSRDSDEAAEEIFVGEGNMKEAMFSGFVDELDKLGVGPARYKPGSRQQAAHGRGVASGRERAVRAKGKLEIRRKAESKKLAPKPGQLSEQAKTRAREQLKRRQPAAPPGAAPPGGVPPAAPPGAALPPVEPTGFLGRMRRFPAAAAGGYNLPQIPPEQQAAGVGATLGQRLLGGAKGLWGAAKADPWMATGLTAGGMALMPQVAGALGMRRERQPAGMAPGMVPTPQGY